MESQLKKSNCQAYLQSIFKSFKPFQYEPRYLPTFKTLVLHYQQERSTQLLQVKILYQQKGQKEYAHKLQW